MMMMAMVTTMMWTNYVYECDWKNDVRQEQFLSIHVSRTKLNVWRAILSRLHCYLWLLRHNSAFRLPSCWTRNPWTCGWEKRCASSCPRDTWSLAMLDKLRFCSWLCHLERQTKEKIIINSYDDWLTHIRKLPCLLIYIITSIAFYVFSINKINGIWANYKSMHSRQLHNTEISF